MNADLERAASTTCLAAAGGRLASFRAWFHGLKVSQKLALISGFFILPDSVMLYLFITGINANIEFSRMEQKGNEYQRPLEDLLELIPEHRQIADAADLAPEERRERLREKAAQIEQAFDRLEMVDRKIGKDLQFTDEGLAKRKREHYRAHIVRGEWSELARQVLELTPQERAAEHEHLVGDIRVMITHAGDLSNLILDPDLDSYYLMDATLLGLPQAQDRFAQVMAHGEAVLRGKEISPGERQQFAIFAQLMREADLERIRRSVQTSLNEDPNFFGISPTLQERLPRLLQTYVEAAERFIDLTRRIADSQEVAARDYLEAGRAARHASFVLWNVADNEVDTLLQRRIDAFRQRRFDSLLVAGCALLAAVGFVTFITRSISGPLQRQAAELQRTNDTLEAEIAERKRAEAELRRSEAQLAAAQKMARIGSWEWDIATGAMTWSEELYRIHGVEPTDLKTTYPTMLGFVAERERGQSDEAFRRALQEKKAFSFTQHIVRGDGKERTIHQRGDVVLDASGKVTRLFGTAQDITERKRAEEEMAKMHQTLLAASRQAGMAEVATGVLHNVGNVLNSVNVSAMLISERLSKSRVSHLTNVATLLRDHSRDLPGFFTADSRGQALPAFVTSLAERLGVERTELLREMEGLAKNIAHIKEIVSVQQEYAKVSGLSEVLSPASLVEDALEMNAAALERHRVEVIRDFFPAPPVQVDKHKVLQILVNLIRNAKYAVSEADTDDKRVTVRIRPGSSGRVLVQVVDNGIGIAPENLSRIFAHGFTTKKDGHGFGLHSSALAAKETGGALFASSGGPGRGATFTLELPVAEEALTASRAG